MRALTWSIAALMAATALNGLLTGLGARHPDPRTLSLVAQDAVLLVFVLPALLMFVHVAHRGSTRGSLGWMASLFYVAYAYGLALATPDVTPAYPAHVVIACAAAYGTARLAGSLDIEGLVAHVGRAAHERVIAAFLLVTAGFFACLWARLAMWHLPGNDVAPVHRLVTSIDGIVLLPLLVFGGRWLAGREPLGYVLAAVLLVKTTFTFLTLVACAALTWRAGLPNHPALTGAFLAGLLASAVLSVVYFRQIRDR